MDDLAPVCSVAVVHQLPPLAEGRLACSTGEGQLAPVALHVPLQMVARDEPLGTEPAPVGLLSRVDPPVDGEVRGVGESLATIIAPVGLALTVLLLVDPQRAPVSEALGTLGAAVGLVAGVDAPVASHRSMIAKFFWAKLTGEWTLTCV